MTHGSAAARRRIRIPYLLRNLGIVLATAVLTIGRVSALAQQSASAQDSLAKTDDDVRRTAGVRTHTVFGK